jgi:hypothetical protein
MIDDLKEETQKLVFDLKEDMNKQLNGLKENKTNRQMKLRRLSRMKVEINKYMETEKNQSEINNSISQIQKKLKQ